jgi:hypothetical protein
MVAMKASKLGKALGTAVAIATAVALQVACSGGDGPSNCSQEPGTGECGLGKIEPGTAQQPVGGGQSSTNSSGGNSSSGSFDAGGSGSGGGGSSSGGPPGCQCIGPQPQANCSGNTCACASAPSNCTSLGSNAYCC